jgi:beta-fructofuranosidase
VEEGERGGDDVRNWRRIDHGHLFAAKCFFDARKNRRVLWAWVDETDGSSEVTSGVMTDKFWIC